METLMLMMMMEIDALPFKILASSSSSSVLVEMLMEAAAMETAAAEQQGSAPRAWMNFPSPLTPHFFI
jgi:hypothetical protein